MAQRSKVARAPSGKQLSCTARGILHMYLNLPSRVYKKERFASFVAQDNSNYLLRRSHLSLALLEREGGTRRVTGGLPSGMSVTTAEGSLKHQGKKANPPRHKKIFKKTEQMFAFSEKVCYNTSATNICFNFNSVFIQKRGQKNERTQRKSIQNT